MLLTAIKGHDYENKWRSPGDEYEADPQFAVGLVASGYAQVKVSSPARSPQPEPTPAVAVDETTKRKYQRRDMVPVK